MTNETIMTLCALIGTLLSLLGLFFSLLAKSKNKKARTIAESMLEVIGYTREAVKIAEQYANFTGDEKKAYATTLIKQRCIEEGIKINDEEISNDIEHIISISKDINSRAKDKEK